ncbi:MAG: MFS transporter [Ilumatobacteraceae bacterium]
MSSTFTTSDENADEQRGPERAPRLGRRFLTVWFGQTVSTVGTYVSAIGAAVYIFTTTGSVIWLGVLAATSGVAAIAAAPLLGRIDQFERRTVMIAADLLAAAAAVVALVLLAAGRLEVWHLVLTGFIGGIGNAFQIPASMAALPALAGGALDRANGLIQLGPAVAMVVGPAIGAALVGWYGIGAVLWFDVLTFAVAVVATASTPFRAGVAGPSPAGVDRRGWAPAIAWLRAEGRPLLTLIAVMAVINLLLGYFNVAMLALATDLGGPARAGLVPSVAGVGMVVASLVVGARGLPSRRVATLATGLAVIGLGLVIAALRPSFALLIIGITLALVVVPVLNATSATIFNERVPADVQGRVFGLRLSIGRALDPIGSATAGFVIALLAAPAMSDGGPLASSAGALIGTGAGRAPALVVMVIGLGLVGVSLLVRRNTQLARLDAAPEVERPTDALAGATV